MADLLADVREFRNQLYAIAQQADAELEDMLPYITGERQSKYPIGSRFLLNRGQELQQLVTFVEMSLKKVTPR